MGETDKLQREVDEMKLKPYNCVCVNVDGGAPSSVCSQRWVWEPLGVSGRDPVEVILPRAGGEAKGKYQVSGRPWWGERGVRGGGWGWHFKGDKLQELLLSRGKRRVAGGWSAFVKQHSKTTIPDSLFWQSGEKQAWCPCGDWLFFSFRDGFESLLFLGELCYGC